jgi:acetate kinase
MALILTLNAGSSSIKFGLYDTAPDPSEHLRGQIDRLGPEARLVLDGGARDVAAPDHAAGLSAILEALAPRIDGGRIAGIGHRVVHGGPDIDAPQVLTPDLAERLDALCPLAPLHQPHNLAGCARPSRPSPRRCRWPVSTPPFTAATHGSTTPSPCRAASTTKACGATASTG